MEKYTFGNSKAAVNLSEILTKRNDKKLSSKVSRILVSYFHGLKEIDKIENQSVKTRIIELWCGSYSRNISNLDGEVKSFVDNLLKKERKERQNKIKGNIKKK